MRIVIGIILIVISSVLFTVLLSLNTPWIMATSPLFIIGFILVYSKIQEMEDDITWLEVKLNELNKGERRTKK